MLNLNFLGNQRKTSFKRLISVFTNIVLLIVVVFSLTGSVGAEPETVLTGCLNEESGQLRNVALGLAPKNECSSVEVQVTWYSGIPGIESRVVALEERVAKLENNQAPLELTVNCPEESINKALNRAINRNARLTITVVGVCTEEVRIFYDNITIRGASLGDGIQAPSPDNWAVLMIAARGVELEQLTIIGGRVAIFAVTGTAFTARNLHLSNADACVSVQTNSIGSVKNSILENCGDGVRVSRESMVYVNGGLINNSGHGIQAMTGGTAMTSDGLVIKNGQTGIFVSQAGNVEVSNTTIENNQRSGVSAFFDGSIAIYDSIIQNNAKGVSANGGSTLRLDEGVTVANSEDIGVEIQNSSTILLGDVVIENNGNDGLFLGGSSSAWLWKETIIRDNSGHGISLGGNSTAFFNDASLIAGNLGTAIACGYTYPDYNDTALVSGWSPTVSGNGSDTIECPSEFR